MSFFSLFNKKITPKTTVPFEQKELVKSIVKNRKTLNEIDNWISEEAFSASFFNYGVPDYIRTEINKKINSNPTYSDYILHIANTYFSNVNYLEIGVSVGKNFFQIVKGLENATFTGFDIEEINPIIEQKFKLEHITEWDTGEASIKKNKSSLRQFKSGNKKVDYISADVLDKDSWAKLKGRKFNLIFSDALHTPDAIIFEFDMLVKFDLLDKHFVIVWDDLVGEMQLSFFSIIKKFNRKLKIKSSFLINANGWVGEHEQPHTIGIISDFSFE